ncbi:phosphotransferase [Neobacillus mesonae]|uniref:Aminoglycoside phosphotransferase domain-containing protein n=1 Tax=Neobacillus mesonae TaxID=1193713 RepID=A0A3T0I5U3_9BACI|nr:phosphotransferase [Neobacillus mesonae]AZU64695.1 hypothetical protein CHR53_27610 [Neobacillus mesonae]
MSDHRSSRLPEGIVLGDGRLNDEMVCSREILYRGNNGRCVERFYLPSGESYIFKPLTNNAQFGKEVWAHEQVLPLVGAGFPKIISYRVSGEVDLCWLIFEDLGPLSHEFNKESLLAVVRSAVVWHSLPVASFADVPLSGMKLGVEEMRAEVLAGREKFSGVGLLGPVWSRLESFIFSKKQVISHGDLHQGNYALVDGRLFVLDWEHAHLNLPYWDLYHVIDMAHPVFLKKMTRRLREEALDCYLDGVGAAVERAAFKKEYYLFAVVFSLWMLLLIEQDLQADEGKWSNEQLERQHDETIAGLEQLCECILKS